MPSGIAASGVWHSEQFQAYICICHRRHIVRLLAIPNQAHVHHPCRYHAHYICIVLYTSTYPAKFQKVPKGNPRGSQQQQQQQQQQPAKVIHNPGTDRPFHLLNSVRREILLTNQPCRFLIDPCHVVPRGQGLGAFWHLGIFSPGTPWGPFLPLV